MEPNPRRPEDAEVEQCIGCGESVTIWSKRQLTPEGEVMCPTCRRHYRAGAKKSQALAHTEREKAQVERQTHGGELSDRGICPGPRLAFEDPELQHEPLRGPSGKWYCRVCFRDVEPPGDLSPNGGPEWETDPVKRVTLEHILWKLDNARTDRDLATGGRGWVQIKDLPGGSEFVWDLIHAGVLEEEDGFVRRAVAPKTTVEPNKARALGSRPAMRTNFGNDLDPADLDSLGGPEGSDVDGAMRRYETFHAKQPIRVTELVHDLPTSWVCIGDGLAVMYRTDKWKKDGVDEDYKHLHDAGDNKPYPATKGVRFYEPATRGQRGVRLPTPKAITLLGYCLGAFVRKDSDGHEYETNPRGCYLFAAPDGHTLYLYSPDKQPDGSSGFLAALHGGKLRVLKDGIDG